MAGRGVGQTAGRAVRPSSTCLEAGKQHARHITATSSSHMVSRSLRKSLQAFANHSNIFPRSSSDGITTQFQVFCFFKTQEDVLNVKKKL